MKSLVEDPMASMLPDEFKTSDTTSPAESDSRWQEPTDIPNELLPPEWSDTPTIPDELLPPEWSSFPTEREALSNAPPMPPASAPLGTLPIPEADDEGSLAFKARLQQEAQANAKKEGALVAAGRKAAWSAAPTIGGVASGALVGTGLGLLGANPFTAAAGGLVGGIAGGLGIDILQTEFVKKYFPQFAAEQEAKLAAAEVAHPYATMAGGLVPQLLTAKPSLANVKTAFDAAKMIVKGQMTPAVMATPIGRQAIDQLYNVGLGAGISGIQEAYQQYQTGDMNAGRLIGQMVAGAILNEPTKFGVALGLHPTTREPDVIVPQESAAPAQPTLTPEQLADYHAMTPEQRQAYDQADAYNRSVVEQAQREQDAALNAQRATPFEEQANVPEMMTQQETKDAIQIGRAKTLGAQPIGNEGVRQEATQGIRQGEQGQRPAGAGEPVVRPTEEVSRKVVEPVPVEQPISARPPIEAATQAPPVREAVSARETQKQGGAISSKPTELYHVGVQLPAGGKFKSDANGIVWFSTSDSAYGANVKGSKTTSIKIPPEKLLVVEDINGNKGPLADEFYARQKTGSKAESLKIAQDMGYEAVQRSKDVSMSQDAANKYLADLVKPEVFAKTPQDIEVGSKVRIGMQVRPFEVISKPDADGYFDVRNTKTGEIQKNVRVEDVRFQTGNAIEGTTIQQQRGTAKSLVEPLGGSWTEGKSEGHIGTWSDAKSGLTIEFRHEGVEGPTTGPRAGQKAMGKTQRVGRDKYVITVDPTNGDITTPPHELAEIVGMAARKGIPEAHGRVVSKALKSVDPNIDLNTTEGAHRFAVAMETQDGRNKVADALRKAAPGAQAGFKKWINNVIRFVNRLFGSDIAEFKDKDFVKLAEGMRDFTALKQLAEYGKAREGQYARGEAMQGKSRVTPEQDKAYQTKPLYEPTGNATLDAANQKMDAWRASVNERNRSQVSPFNRLRYAVGKNIATLQSQLNVTRERLGKIMGEAGKIEGAPLTLAEKSYIMQQAQQGSGAQAKARFNDVMKAWREHGFKQDQDLAKLGDYMGVKRMVELYGTHPEMKHPLTLEEAQAKVDSVERGADGDRYKKAADATRKGFNDSLDVLQEAGIISPEKRDRIANSSEFYMPRAFLEEVAGPVMAIEKTKLGNVEVRQSGVRFLQEGSEGEMMTDPLMLLGQNISHAEALASKNKNLTALRDLAVKATPEMKRTTDFDIHEIPWDSSPRRGYEKLEFWDNGVKKALEVRTDLANAMKMVDPAISDDIAKLLRHASGTSALKFLATAGNPEFAVGNILRDLGLHFLGGNTYSPIMPVALGQMGKQAAKIQANRALKAKLRREFLKYGGGNETWTRQGLSGFEQDMMTAKALKHGNKVIKGVADALSYLGNKTEEITRLMMMNQELEKMGTDAFRATPEQLMKAVSAGKEIINFHDHGKAVKALDTIIPFLNPAFQGGRTVARAFKNRPIETTLKAMQIVAGSALLQYWNRRNDEKTLESISDSDKATRLNITLNARRSDKEGFERNAYLGLPMDQAWRPFMVLGQMIADKLDGKPVNPDLLKKSIADNYVPLSFNNLPPVVAAMLTYSQNHDFWTGQEVWKGRDVLPYMERKATTPLLAEKAGDITGLSPERLTAAAKKIAPQNMLISEPQKWMDALLGDEVKKSEEDNLVSVAKMPFVRRLFRMTSPRELSQQKERSAQKLGVKTEGRSPAAVMNELQLKERQANTIKQKNDVAFDKLVARLRTGEITKADIYRAAAKVKDENGRFDPKERIRILRNLKRKYPTMGLQPPSQTQED